MAVSNENLKSALFYYRRGFVYQELGEYQAALNNYQMAINLDSLHPEYYFYKGLVHKKLSELDQCLSHMQTAKKMFNAQGHFYGGQESKKIINSLG